jgi:hypothetical protein
MRYKKLNRVISPDHLDQIILSEAHRLAPRKLSARSPWAPAFATACVIGLGLVVVKPLFDNLNSPNQPEILILESVVEMELQQETAMPESVESNSNYSLVPSSAEPMVSVKKMNAETPVDPVSVAAQNIEAEISLMQKTEKHKSSIVGELGIMADEAVLEKPRVWYENLSPQPSVTMIDEIQKLLDQIDLHLQKGEIEKAQKLLNLANEQCPICSLQDDVTEL